MAVAGCSMLCKVMWGRIFKKLQMLRNRIMDWNWSKFGYIDIAIREMECRD